MLTPLEHSQLYRATGIDTITLESIIENYIIQIKKHPKVMLKAKKNFLKATQKIPALIHFTMQHDIHRDLCKMMKKMETFDKEVIDRLEGLSLTLDQLLIIPPNKLNIFNEKMNDFVDWYQFRGLRQLTHSLQQSLNYIYQRYTFPSDNVAINYWGNYLVNFIEHDAQPFLEGGSFALDYFSK